MRKAACIIGSLLLLVACSDSTTEPTQDLTVPKPEAQVSDGPGKTDTGGQVDTGLPLDVGPTWDPSELGASLVVWLDAAKGVVEQGDVVSTWQDQSGADNHASQATAGNRPTVVADVINGKPVIRFDGVNQYLTIADAASLQWGTDDFTVMEVVAWTNDAANSYGAMWVKAEVPSPYKGPSLFGNDSVSKSGSLRGQVAINVYATTSDTALNDGSFHYLGMRRTGTTLELRNDGQQDGTVASAGGDVSATGRPVDIGGRGTSQQLKGDIAEIVAIKGALTNADLAQLEGYLKAKYGL